MNKEALKEALEDTRKSMDLNIPIKPTTLFDHLKWGYDHWKQKRLLKKSLEKTKKDLIQKQQKPDELKEMIQRIENRFSSLPEWFLVLPIYRVSDGCKETIQELVLADIKKQTDKQVEEMEKFNLRMSYDTIIESTTLDESTIKK